MANQLEPGDYNIINGAQAPGAVDLYLTFVNQNANVTLNPANGAGAQVWTVSGAAGGPQTIAPHGANLRATGTVAGDYIRVTPNPGNWGIAFDQHSGLYTIQTQNQALFWTIAAGVPVPGAFVSLQGGTGNAIQHWNFRVA